MEEGAKPFIFILAESSELLSLAPKCGILLFENYSVTFQFPFLLVVIKRTFHPFILIEKWKCLHFEHWLLEKSKLYTDYLSIIDLCFNDVKVFLTLFTVSLNLTLGNVTEMPQNVFFFTCSLLKYFLKCCSKNNMKSATLVFKILVMPSPIILCKPKSRTFHFFHSLPFISVYVNIFNLNCYRCQNSTVSTCPLDVWFSDVNVFLTLFIVCLNLTLDSVTEMPQKCIIC